MLIIGSPGSGTVIGVLVLVKINFEESRDCKVDVTFTTEAVWASFFSTAAAVSSEASWTTCGGVTAEGAMLEEGGLKYLTESVVTALEITKRQVNQLDDSIDKVIVNCRSEKGSREGYKSLYRIEIESEISNGVERDFP